MEPVSSNGILIVDDNEMNREICELHLEDMDIPLLFAKNGQEGLIAALASPPDLILLDIMMPVMDGLEMLKRLKSETTLKDIPVLMLTAKQETETVVTALELGANDYLRKPFEGEEMIARANTLLKSRRLEKQIANDLKAGAKIQKKFLNDSESFRDLFFDHSIEFTTFNKPFSNISGDFFYQFSTINNTPGFFLGDTCGHGLSAALISMRIIGLMQVLSKTFERSDEILNALNHDLTGLVPQGKFISGTALIFNNDQITFSNAGQPYPFLISQGKIVEIKAPGFPLGINPNQTYNSKTTPFHKGDKLILLTDGLLETTDEHGTLFGLENLPSYLRSNTGLEACDLISGLLKRNKEFRGENLIEDDISIAIFEHT